MCDLDLRPEADGLPRLLLLTLTPAELDYLRIGMIANMATKSLHHVFTHHMEMDDFIEEHDDPHEIHNSINRKMAPLFGLTLCPKCDQFHQPGCEVHNSQCNGLEGVTL